jgi:hypothetical protein
MGTVVVVVVDLEGKPPSRWYGSGWGGEEGWGKRPSDGDRQGCEGHRRAVSSSKVQTFHIPITN